MTTEPISKAAFASLLQVSAARVSQWLATGAISGDAIVGTGRKALIRPVLAQAQLRARLDVGQRRAQLGAAPPRPVETENDAREAVRLILRVLREEGVTADVVDYAAARTAKTILEARDRELRIAERRKELVPLANVREHIAKAFVSYRQAIQRMPSRFAAEVAADCGCDPAKIETGWSRAIATTLEEMSAPAIR